MPKYGKYNRIDSTTPVNGMKRFSFGLVLLLAFQINFGTSSFSPKEIIRSRSDPETDYIKDDAKVPGMPRSHSESSVKTDREDSPLNLIEEAFSQLFYLKDQPNTGSAITFDGLVFDDDIFKPDLSTKASSCYGGSGIKRSKSANFLEIPFESSMEDSGLTSTSTSILSNNSFMDSYGVRTRTAPGESDVIICGTPYEKRNERIGEESGANYFFFDQFVVEVVKDCFGEFPIDNFDINWTFDTFIPFLQSGQLLQINTAFQILERVYEVFKGEETIKNIKIAEDENLFVVGDIHGQFEDLLRIFDQNGRPQNDKKFIFNGDIVDRGSNSLECLLTLFLLKIQQPNNIFITRGNHESETCGDGSFKEECFDKMSGDFFIHCQKTFDILPLAYIINDKFFVCHGGLPKGFNIEQLRHASKPNYDVSQSKLAFELLWNDPHEGLGMRESKRGGYTFSFGSDITKSFLQRHELELLIRSHEYHREGYFFCHDNLCLTIFSAPNYCGIGNKGTVMKIDSNLHYEILPIITLDMSSELTASMYLRQEKKRSPTINIEDHEFVFLP